MPIGPVEYIILGFPANKFTGEIVPALAKLVESGTIRIIDLAFITKGADGEVSGFEFDQLDEFAPFAALEGEAGGLISREDIEYAGQDLDRNSSAALLVWEDTWAIPLVESLRKAGGVLIEGSRIPHELIEAAFAELQSAG